MRERVSSCKTKIAQYCCVRELEVEGSRKRCGVPQRDAENRKKDRALEREVSERMLAEGK